MPNGKGFSFISLLCAFCSRLLEVGIPSRFAVQDVTNIRHGRGGHPSLAPRYVHVVHGHRFPGDDGDIGLVFWSQDVVGWVEVPGVPHEGTFVWMQDHVRRRRASPP